MAAPNSSSHTKINGMAEGKMIEELQKLVEKKSIGAFSPGAMRWFSGGTSRLLLPAARGTGRGETSSN